MDTRVAVVTGGSSRIGEQAALRLRKAGFEVYAVARRVDRMAHLEERGIHTFAMDVTDDESMTGGIARVVAEQGRIDVLVNNAGYGSYGAVEHVSIDEARRQFEVNVFGLARLTQLVTPHMRARGSGRIINISSVGAVISDSLRVELAQFGIDVVIIRPAGILTERNQISRDSLVETSRDGVHAEQAVTAARRLASVDNRLMSSGPRTVARTIVRAAKAERPRTRYASGRGARLVMATRRMLPDRAFDAFLTRAYLR